MRKLLVLAMIGALFTPLGSSVDGQTNDASDAGRKVRTEVAPVYPDLARQMNISGVVKVRVVVDPEGRVVNAQEIGGHPLLIPAAMAAAKKFRFEAGPRESTQVIQFRFGQPR